MPQSAFRVVSGFSTVDPNGRRAVFPTGTVVPSDHWAIAGRESLFRPLDLAPAVERATAEPGERRSTRRKSDDV